MSQRSPRSKALGGIERQQARGAGPRRHLADLERNRLVLDDRLAEGLAQLRVAGGKPQRALGDADTARRHVDAAEFEAAGHLGEAAALDLADQMIGRDAVILEDQLAQIDRLVAELLELAADLEARPLGRDEEAHAGIARACLGVGLDQQREARALDAVGDPGLGAVDDVVVALTPRGHADRLQVGAGIGLGQRQPAADLTRGELGQPLALLRLGAELLDRERQHQVRVEDAGDRHPHRGDLHHDLGVGGGRQSQPAILGRDGGAEQAELLHLLDELGRPFVGVVELLDPRRHLALDPAVDGGEKLRLVRRVDLVHFPLPDALATK